MNVSVTLLSGLSSRLWLMAVVAAMAVVMAAFASSRVVAPASGVLVMDDTAEAPIAVAAARAAQPDVAATVVQFGGAYDLQDLTMFADHWPTPVVMVVEWDEVARDLWAPEDGELWVLSSDGAAGARWRQVVQVDRWCARDGLQGRVLCGSDAALPEWLAAATGIAADLDEVLRRSDLASSAGAGAIIGPTGEVEAPARSLWSGVGAGWAVLLTGLAGAASMTRLAEERARGQTLVAESLRGRVWADSHGAGDSSAAVVAERREPNRGSKGVVEEEARAPSRTLGGMLPNEVLERQGVRHKAQNWVDPFGNPDPDGVDAVVTGQGRGAGRSWMLASARGTSHTAGGKPNQDRASVRSVQRGRYLVAAVADGVGGCPWSHVGSREMIEFALDSIEDELGAGTVPAELDMATIAQTSATSFAESRPDDDLGQYGTTLAVAVIPRKGKVGWAGRVGDSTILTLNDEGGWRDPFPAKPGRVTDALPMHPDRAEQCVIDTSGVVIPITDGLLGALSGPEGATVRTLFAKRFLAGLADGQALLELITDEQIVCSDDRTLIVAAPTSGRR